MSITVTFDAAAKAGAADALQALFAETLPDTRKFEGCISVATYSENDRPDTIFMVEEWTSRSAYEKYLDWRRERGDMDKLMNLVQGPPVIRFFNSI